VIVAQKNDLIAREGESWRADRKTVRQIGKHTHTQTHARYAHD